MFGSSFFGFYLTSDTCIGECLNWVIYDEVSQAAISKAPHLNFLVSIVYSEGQLLET